MARTKASVSGVVSSGFKSAATRRRSASSAAHQEAQHPLYAAPWVLFAAGGVLGQVLFVIWGERPWLYLPQVGMVAATTALAYAGWLNTRSRTPLALGHTLATIILSGLWLILCSITGMVRLEYVEWAVWRMPSLQHPTFDLYIIMGASLALAWCMRMGVHAKEARDAAGRGESTDEWDEAGIPGVRGTLKQKNEYFLEGTLKLPGGMTVKDLQHRRGPIESAFDWPQNSLTILPGPQWSTSRRVKARVMVKDPFENGTEWQGIERNPKLTMLDPFREGIREDGVISTVYVAKEEGAKHFLVQGITGAGKTAGQYSILLDSAYRGAVQIVIDTVSGIQMFGHIAPALQWLITDAGLAKAVIRRLAEEVIPARMDQLARERKPNWDPSSSLKLLRVHIEEAWSLLDADELMDIAVTARKAGVQLVISLQRASHDQLNTTVREQLGTRFCFGLGGSFGTMILDDEVLEAGADPTKWKDEQPGMHYLTRGGLSVSEKASATRAFWDKNGKGKVTYEQEALSLVGKISEMDEVSAEAFGVLWEQHVAPVELVRQARENPVPRRSDRGRDASLSRAVHLAHPSIAAAPDLLPSTAADYHPIFAKAAAAVGLPDAETDVTAVSQHSAEEECDDEVLLLVEGGGNVLRMPGPDGEEVIDFSQDPDLEDPDPELQLVGDPFAVEFAAPPAGMRLGVARTKVSKEQLDTMMADRFDQLRRENRSMISSSDFTEVILKSGGWARTNVYNYFNAWVADGLVIKTDDGQLLMVRQQAS